ncbi:aerobic ribonucleoside diphosphate reductase, small subunit [Klebsiella phage KpGranit]|uniref:ribonucleoside-diphosphate reductase n=3 Tax=Viruses TaxID=10239 RepID=A0A5B8R3I1_9CAUD|nr:ribonucleoside-diphosphate reductase subunit beta [Klebsiella phage vB_KpnS_FZ41]QEA03152.1 aerobic ribonucleoside diphosphate reductase, small subunit [Klebsiella phage KpGranit]CAK6605532.1 ribonucleoside diphosphate reductase small subunit [Klebsiella phage vB_Kpn_K7PH164C4]
MATVFNREWDHTESKLFLGQDLGIADYVNVRYPRLEELALLQRSQFWVETEISLEADKKQWPNLPQHIKNKTLLNLAWQTQADSIITRAPEDAILKLVSRPELEGMLIQWSYFENIHSRAYSNIIRNVLPNPGEFIATVQANDEAFARLALPVSVIDELAEIADIWLDARANLEIAEKEGTLEYTEEADFLALTEQVQQKILEFYYAVYALEAIMFYASFACTFALAENDILTGIAKNLQLIAKDEALHTVMAMEVLRILQNGEIPPHVVAAAQANAPKILRSILETEINWAHYIFPEGEDIPGLNADLLVEYLYYNARLAFMAINIPWPEDLPVIMEDPIGWMKGWLNTKNQQVAPQEAQITNYRVGATSQANPDDLSDEFGEFL